MLPAAAGGSCLEDTGILQRECRRENTMCYYTTPKDNAAFERCIDMMSRWILKYGPDMLETIEQEEMRDIHCADADHVL